jgi:hypothetical protein
MSNQHARKKPAWNGAQMVATMTPASDAALGRLFGQVEPRGPEAVGSAGSQHGSAAARPPAASPARPGDIGGLFAH